VLEESLLEPRWDLPPGVRAFVTTRSGGHSVGPWQSFNLARHVQDDDDLVSANRARLISGLQRRTGILTPTVQWVQQVHGIDVLRVENAAQAQESAPPADAVYTQQAGVACAVLTADCLPVLFCSSDGKEIAIAHAGWRGLCNGVLEATVRQFSCGAAAIQAWLGPAIALCHFEVGSEVREAFCNAARPQDLAATRGCFQSGASAGKCMADLYELARIRLRAAGLTGISGEPQCTVCHADRFYSYRHQAVTGRFATLIIKNP
jgi:YfiH family protein